MTFLITSEPSSSTTAIPVFLNRDQRLKSSSVIPFNAYVNEERALAVDIAARRDVQCAVSAILLDLLDDFHQFLSFKSPYVARNRVRKDALASCIDIEILQEAEDLRLIVPDVLVLIQIALINRFSLVEDKDTVMDIEINDKALAQNKVLRRRCERVSLFWILRSD